MSFQRESPDDKRIKINKYSVNKYALIKKERKKTSFNGNREGKQNIARTRLIHTVLLNSSACEHNFPARCRDVR